MNRYKAYTQKEWNAEKFYIEDDNQVDLIIYAENEEEAKNKFIENIYETSLYSERETKEWLEKNTIYILEIKEEIQYVTIIRGKTDVWEWCFETPQEAINYAKELNPCDKRHKIEVWEIERTEEMNENYIRQLY